MKVGDYYRTEYGINKLTEGKCVLNDIIKSSPNIIDLIEVGDYVNGWRVMKKTDDYFFIGDESEGTWHLLFDEIKTIVTHEQFSQMEYKVGD